MTTRVASTGSTVEAPLVVRALRLLFAVYDIAALVECIIRGHQVPGFTLGNFFSYFTVLSNVLAILVLLVGALAPPRTGRWEIVRCSVTVYIVITGIIYALLLSRIDVGVQNDWTNDALHRVIPLVMLIDWIVMPARTAIRTSQVMLSLAFPFLYGVYSLIRGPIVGWYPYPFIDPRPNGYLSMAIGLVIILIGFVLIALSVNTLGRLGARRRHGATG